MLARQGSKRGTRAEVKKMGPLKVAALNGLSLSRLPMHDEGKDEPENTSNDERVRAPSPSTRIMYCIMEPICTLYWLTVCVCVCVFLLLM